MSNGVFQSVILQLKEISDRIFGVIDSDGAVISCTDHTLLGERWHDAVLKVSGASEGIVTFGQRTLKIRVLDVRDFTAKADASSLYEVIE